MFPQGFIVDVARAGGRQVVAQSGGREYLTRCPWARAHRDGDSHPSCRLNLDKNTFYCDPCGRGGGVKEFAEALRVSLAALSPSGRVRGQRRERRPLVFAAKGPIGAEIQAYFANTLGKAYPPETWAAFGVLEGRVCPKGCPDRSEDAIAFPLPSGGQHVYRYRRVNRNRRWAFSDGGRPDLLVVGLDHPDPVVLAEGAWDAMRAYSDGFAVATGTGGAGTWKPAWNEKLAGHEVAEILDVDPAGRAGAQKAAASLLGSGIPVRPVVLPLAGTPDAKDLSDYRRDHSIDELKALIAQTAPVLPFVKPTTGAGLADDLPPEVLEVFQASGFTDLKKGAGIAEIESALRALTPVLLTADPLRRALLRETVIAKLKALGLAAPAKAIDALLGNDKQEGISSGAGASQPFILAPVEPATEPVDGAQLLTAISEAIRRHVILPPGAADAIGLWILHAHAFDAFFISPFLALTSPTRRCGKTTTLDIITALVPRPLPASNITAAALFRVIEAHHPTLLIDEADAFLGDKEELRGILDAGHTRTTALVIRSVGDNHEPKCFSTWCPKVIARIGQLSETLEDRSIGISMRRRTKGEKVERLRRQYLFTQFEDLRRQAARWAADHLDALRDADPAVPDEFNDREQDNWRCLLAIADEVGGEWPDRARQAARVLRGSQVEKDDAAGVMLLEDLHRLFDRKSTEALSTEEILRYLNGREDRPWPEYRRGKPITARQMAALLSPFGVKPRAFRRGAEKLRGYLRQHLEDPFARYLPTPHPVHPVQPCDFNGLGHESHPVQDPICTGNESDLTHWKESPVPDVPDTDPPPAAEQQDEPANEDVYEEFEV